MRCDIQNDVKKLASLVTGGFWWDNYAFFVMTRCTSKANTSPNFRKPTMYTLQTLHLKQL